MTIVLYIESWGNDDRVYTHYYIPYPDGKVVQGCAGKKDKRQRKIYFPPKGSLCLYHNANHYQLLEVEPSKAISNISFSLIDSVSIRKLGKMTCNNGHDYWVCTHCSVIVPSLLGLCPICEEGVTLVPLEYGELKTFVRQQRLLKNSKEHKNSKEQLEEISTIVENKELQVVEVDAQATEVEVFERSVTEESR